MPLDAARARRVYDRIGRLQDTQRFYEDRAIHRVVELAAFERSEAVFELGCGTGRLAADLLASRMPTSARYIGVDVSPRMVGLARRRLAPWSNRATVELLEPPALELPGEEGSFDRFVATYVFDLLSGDDAGALLREAHRLLCAEGILAVVSLTNGTTPASRVVSAGWSRLGNRRPALVGGCRPIELRDLIGGPGWQLRQAEVVVRFGVPSEVVVASVTPG